MSEHTTSLSLNPSSHSKFLSPVHVYRIGVNSSKKAGDSKKHIARTCPEDLSDKYYPDPDNCANYYRCVHGKEVFFSCGPGTVFNPKFNNCDWPQNVECPETTSAPPAGTVLEWLDNEPTQVLI